ncbi:unnamed protein product [Withania somnifera]
MARKRKAEGLVKTHDDRGNIVAASQIGAQRPRKRFVGVRQRPSGRWVAEIKDTIHKIRVWLGTFDTAEEAARAYDEAACLLRGANTRTNFWPCSSPSTSALPPKITDLLLSRLRERNKSVAAAAAANDDDDSSNSTSLPDFGHHHQKQQEQFGDGLADFSNQPYTDCLNYPEDHINDNNAINYPEDHITDNNVIANVTASTRAFRGIAQNGYNQESNILPVNSYENTNAEIIEIEEAINTDVEDIDSKIDFQFLDQIGMSCYYSPFDFAEDLLMETMEQRMVYGEETSMVSEAMRMMNYERKFSASLYAFNGITECLKLKMKSAGRSRSEQLSRLRNACKRNLEKEAGNGESNVGITEKDEENSSEVPFSSMESAYDSEFSLWSSIDLPPICFVS